MKIRKNGKTVNLTESEIKQIINKHKIKKFLNEQDTPIITDVNNDGVIDGRDFVEIIMKNFKELFKVEYMGTGGVPITKTDLHNWMAPIAKAMYAAGDKANAAIKAGVEKAEELKRKLKQQ